MILPMDRSDEMDQLLRCSFLSDLKRRLKMINMKELKGLLEREVFLLQNIIKEEEISKEFLNGSLRKANFNFKPCTPECIPLNAKDLILELAHVEKNITSFERQINDLQPRQSERKKVQWNDTTIKNPMETKNIVKETKPTQFISKKNIAYNDVGLYKEKLQPNKLSEQLIKCLNYICIRSHRTAVILQKEAKQQDPYGIFDLDGSIPRDIGPYKNLVLIKSTSMNPDFTSNPNFNNLFKRLRILLHNLQHVDLKPLSYQQKLAFWINVFNASMMHHFHQYGVPLSPQSCCDFTKKASISVGGKKITAYAITHHLLKMPLSHPQEDEYVQLQHLFGIHAVNPNTAFALSCGTRSSPAVALGFKRGFLMSLTSVHILQVRIYTAENVLAELERSKIDYLQASIVVTSNKRIMLPKLVRKHVEEFRIDELSFLETVCNQLPTSGLLRKSIVDCLQSHGTVVLDELLYDNEFQFILSKN